MINRFWCCTLLLVNLAATAGTVTVNGSITYGIGRDSANNGSLYDVLKIYPGSFDSTATGLQAIALTAFSVGANCATNAAQGGCYTTGSIPLSLTFGAFTNAVDLPYVFQSGDVYDHIAFGATTSDLFFGTQEFIFNTLGFAATGAPTSPQFTEIYGSIYEVAPPVVSEPTGTGVVPEPDTVALIILGISVLALGRWKVATGDAVSTADWADRWVVTSKTRWRAAFAVTGHRTFVTQMSASGA